MSNLDHLKSTYFEECAELLDAAYVHLAAIEGGSPDETSVHAIFRAIHSIKGGGGIFGFDRLAAFAHVLETLLDQLRDGRITFAPEVASLLLRSVDTLSDLVMAARLSEERPPGFEDALLDALRTAESCGTVAAIPGQLIPAQEAGTPIDAQARCYRIRFAPHTNALKDANEPLLIIRELKRLGRFRAEVDLSRLPDLAAMDPAKVYLAWTFHVETAMPQAAIEDVFEFVNQDCDLLIEILDTWDAAAAVRLVEKQPLYNVGGPPQVPHPKAPTTSQMDASAAARSIRIDLDKVDRLVNLVGELVINQSMLVQFGNQLPPDLSPGLVNGLETLSQHLRELQESVMAIRAQPVKSVFSRMSRLVREISSQLGKEVRLVISGEGAEIDKTVIEQLADPLTHLLRNALDHGIEFPDEREACGKARHGVIHLSAKHRSGRIVIEVSDDGRGIDREKVLAKARDRGLISLEASLTDEELDNLIFVPGFSTAEAVSGLSGRGVGMDVVKCNIQALGGRITVESRFGFGSRFVLSLPLTLAILDGMIVAVGRESYIVPLTNIMESLRPKREDIHSVVGHGDVLAVRGEYVPLTYLHQRFVVPDAVIDPCQGIVIIVENETAERIGLVVDELLGQQQVVVKSLEANYGPVDGIGGATVVGDGRVALILDISRLQDAAVSPRHPGHLAAFASTPSLLELH